MSVVFDHNFNGNTVGSSFTGDAAYTNIAGSAPTFQDTAHSGAQALRFSGQGIVSEAFGSVTQRVYSRIYKLSAAVTATAEVCQARSSSARGPAIAFTASNGLRLLKADGSAAATGTAQLPVGSEFRVTFSVNGTALTATLFANTSTTTPLETISGTNNTTTAMASLRDGIISVGGLGSGVTLDMSWPIDDSTTEPGPRNYNALVNPGSTVAMSDNFSGLTASTFTGDSVYANLAGRAPVYARAVHQKSLRFIADNQGIIEESFTSTTTRVYSRIYKLSAAPTMTSEILQTRLGAARGPALSFTDTNLPRIVRADATSLTTGSIALPVGVEFRVTVSIVNTAITVVIFGDTTTTTPQQTISGTLPASVAMTAARDGIITATGLGTDVNLEVSWPIDDTTSDPGPRTYPANIIEPPQADAGTDIAAIEPWANTALTGYDVEESYPITARTWVQTAGPAVTLTGTGKTRSYEAPPAIDGASLTFTYSVTAETTVSDSVTHTILPVNERAVVGGQQVPIRIIHAKL